MRGRILASESVKWLKPLGPVSAVALRQPRPAPAVLLGILNLAAQRYVALLGSIAGGVIVVTPHATSFSTHAPEELMRFTRRLIRRGTVPGSPRPALPGRQHRVGQPSIILDIQPPQPNSGAFTAVGTNTI